VQLYLTIRQFLSSNLPETYALHKVKTVDFQDQLGREFTKLVGVAKYCTKRGMKLTSGTHLLSQYSRSFFTPSYQLAVIPWR
ncbi:1157_t:CDS:2, partial [Cetraspora pellucida]